MATINIAQIRYLVVREKNNWTDVQDEGEASAPM